MSQSLIHQVSDSDKDESKQTNNTNPVSIPYSSGLRFRSPMWLTDTELIWSLNPLFIRSQIQIMIRALSSGAITEGLNPLFIRSQIQIGILCQKRPKELQICLNPLFIRSQIQIIL